MGDLLADGAAWLAGQFNAHASQSVVYSRGGLSVTLLATAGRKTYTVDDGTGVLVEFESSDWLIRRTDLKLGGVAVTPQIGDTVTATVGGATCIYEVLPPNQMFGGMSASEQPFTYSDPHRNLLRVHTKLTT